MSSASPTVSAASAQTIVPSRSTVRVSVPDGSSGVLSGGNTNSRACSIGPAPARRAKSMTESPIVASTRRHSRSSARSASPRCSCRITGSASSAHARRCARLRESVTDGGSGNGDAGLCTGGQ